MVHNLHPRVAELLAEGRVPPPPSWPHPELHLRQLDAISERLYYYT